MNGGSSKASANTQRSAAETAIAMSEVLFRFGQIKRVTKMPNGEYESDSHHSFTLATIGYELARTYAPELDAAKVMAYGLTHDLPELITGDMPTLLTSSDELLKKKAKDQAAVAQLRSMLAAAPHTMALVEAYETCADEEAKFVYWLDKTMTILTHFFDNGKNLYELGVRDQDAIETWYEKLQMKLQMNACRPHITVQRSSKTCT